MYKYSCRKCPVRSRCIDASDNSPSARVMIERAFEARTDTLATWALLQKNCLLLKAEQDRSKSALSERIRDAREAKTGELKLKKSPPQKKSTIRRIRPLNKSGQPTSAQQSNQADQPIPDYLQPVSKPKPATSPIRRLSSAKQPAASSNSNLFWFTVSSTKRHISLPTSGQLSLGHFDPNVGIPPDIDLTYEDAGKRHISRRHATVVGKNGHHTIEDLGSRAGVYLNRKRINNGPSRPLKPGDKINLGHVEMVYQQIPNQVLEWAKTGRARHTLTITPTGRKLRLIPNREVTIGRADPHINYIPDIDLNEDGDVARLVSRRHALIQWKNGQLHIEDLGSSFGTRIGGELLTLGQSMPLKPGDHIWIAGCVLAYDIET